MSYRPPPPPTPTPTHINLYFLQDELVNLITYYSCKNLTIVFFFSVNFSLFSSNYSYLIKPSSSSFYENIKISKM